MKLWIRVDASTSRDPRVIAFAKDLSMSVQSALGHLVMVWSAMAEHVPNGQLPGVSSSDPATGDWSAVRLTVEAWCGWKGKGGRFGALFVQHFVTDTGEVRGYAERQGALIDRMARDRERHLRGTSLEDPRSLRGDSTSTVRYATERRTTTPLPTANRAVGTELCARADPNSEHNRNGSHAPAAPEPAVNLGEAATAISGNRRRYGTNPRAQGTNPRSLREKAQAVESEALAGIKAVCAKFGGPVYTPTEAWQQFTDYQKQLISEHGGLRAIWDAE